MASTVFETFCIYGDTSGNGQLQHPLSLLPAVLIESSRFRWPPGVRARLFSTAPRRLFSSSICAAPLTQGLHDGFHECTPYPTNTTRLEVQLLNRLSTIGCPLEEYIAQYTTSYISALVFLLLALALLALLLLADSLSGLLTRLVFLAHTVKYSHVSLYSLWAAPTPGPGRFRACLSAIEKITQGTNRRKLESVLECGTDGNGMMV